MSSDKLTSRWLFQRHSPATLKTWLRQLRYFYFVRAWGGHANDGDEFRTQLIYTDRADLLAKLAALGIYPDSIPADAPRPVIGQAYPAVEFNRFSDEIRRFPDLAQPGHCLLLGQSAYVRVHDAVISIHVAGTHDGNRYEVSEDDFQVCRRLEKYFDALDWLSLLDRSSMEQNPCCVSRTKYPELYE